MRYDDEEIEHAHINAHLFVRHGRAKNRIRHGQQAGRYARTDHGNDQPLRVFEKNHGYQAQSADDQADDMRRDPACLSGESGSRNAMIAAMAFQTDHSTPTQLAPSLYKADFASVVPYW